MKIDVVYSIKHVGISSPDGYERDNWIITLEKTEGKSKETFEYFTGIGRRKNGRPVTPDVYAILSCLCGDAILGREYFSEFCENLGYSQDSRKALDTYLACQENGRKLRKFISSDLQEKIHLGDEIFYNDKKGTLHNILTISDEEIS